MRNYIQIWYLLVLLFIVSCEEYDLERIDKIGIESIDKLENGDAIVNVMVTDLVSDSFVDHGICWSEKKNPTKDDSIISNGDSPKLGKFSCTLKDLNYEVRYYVRAYIETKDKLRYSSITYDFDIEKP